MHLDQLPLSGELVIDEVDHDRDDDHSHPEMPGRDVLKVHYRAALPAIAR